MQVLNTVWMMVQGSILLIRPHQQGSGTQESFEQQQKTNSATVKSNEMKEGRNSPGLPHKIIQFYELPS